MTAPLTRKSNLDVVKDCDKFPYADTESAAHEAIMKDLYTLVWNSPDGTTVPIGYVREDVFLKLTKVPVRLKGEMEVNRKLRTITLFQQETEAERSAAAAATASFWRENKTFKDLAGWRNELYSAYGPNNEVLFNIERSASALFGIVTYGIHMTAFVRDPTASHGMKFWVPRRSYTKSTYPGMLDNTVAGGMAAGENPFECMVREAEEEASLPADLVRKTATAQGKVTYIHITSDKRGGDSGLIQPEVEYIYDLELPPDVIPKPNDNEVAEFYLWTAEEVQEHLAKGEFKPNCGVVILDFFIRHGILTKENEKDYDEIKKRLHRHLEFPGPHHDA